MQKLFQSEHGEVPTPSVLYVVLLIFPPNIVLIYVWLKGGMKVRYGRSLTVLTLQSRP